MDRRGPASSGLQRPVMASRGAIKNEHQTPILRSCEDLPAAKEAVLTFARWRQENFFKYVKVPLGLDQLVGYHWTEADGSELGAPPSAIRWSGI